MDTFSRTSPNKSVVLQSHAPPSSVHQISACSSDVGFSLETNNNAGLLVFFPPSLPCSSPLPLLSSTTDASTQIHLVSFLRKACCKFPRQVESGLKPTWLICCCSACRLPPPPQFSPGCPENTLIKQESTPDFIFQAGMVSQEQ